MNNKPLNYLPLPPPSLSKGILSQQAPFSALKTTLAPEALIVRHVAQEQPCKLANTLIHDLWVSKWV